MAYVIAACGSGGKTTLCKEMAAKYANENKKVCITTTTNMWFDSDVRNSFFQVEEYVVGDEHGKVYYAGNVDEIKKKLKSLNEEDYKKLCDIFDYVIIEADGSRAMPMKIPNASEPIIPDNVNEIIIVVGMESVGRKIGYICHRFNEFYGKDKFLSDNKIEPDTIVTEKLIDDFVNHYYYKPLNEKFPNAKISIYKNDYAKNTVGASTASPFKLCMALCASGFSKRFGNENKLLAKIPITKLVLGDKYDENKFSKDEATQKFLNNEIMIYQLMIEKLLATRDNVLEKYSKELGSNHLQIDIAVVTQYDEIINDKNYSDKVTMIKNDKAELGLSSSIKIAVKKYKDFDAIMFINADLPKLGEEELIRFLYYSIMNNNKMASMFTDIPKNPAYFEKEYFDEILKIDGDKGPRELLDNNIKDLYRYYIDPNQLFEIDTKKDLEKLK
ncbi:MAG: putative selenium-dependent hydroxylase accessory protein YqeC [Lachnospiraceae bacterium]|nr:putative selenium-dependent hydroxylase accessory protein YqeC [Lachnospiraceae bacterium]